MTNTILVYVFLHPTTYLIDFLPLEQLSTNKFGFIECCVCACVCVCARFYASYYIFVAYHFSCGTSYFIFFCSHHIFVAISTATKLLYSFQSNQGSPTGHKSKSLFETYLFNLYINGKQT